MPHTKAHQQAAAGAAKPLGKTPAGQIPTSTVTGGGYSPELTKLSQSVGIDLSDLQAQGQFEEEDVLFGNMADLMQMRLRFTPEHEAAYTAGGAVALQPGQPQPEPPGMPIMDIVADFFTMDAPRLTRLQESFDKAGLYGKKKPVFGQSDEKTFEFLMDALLGVARKQWARDRIAKRQPKTAPTAAIAPTPLAPAPTPDVIGMTPRGTS